MATNNVLNNSSAPFTVTSGALTLDSTTGQINAGSNRFIGYVGTDCIEIGIGAGASLSGNELRNILIGSGAGNQLNYSGNPANAHDNICIGYQALYGQGSGTSGESIDNICIGSYAGQVLADGCQGNTILGYAAGQNMQLNSSYNTLIGFGAGINLTQISGVSHPIGNIAIGPNVGYNWIHSESFNIAILNNGVAGESNTIRIGTTGTGDFQQNSCYIAGIYPQTITGTAVFVTSDDQLGIATSSQKYKDDITDMSDMSQIIASLRPVTFTYKTEKSPKPLHYGLIAEEVEKIWPEMVGYRDGQPDSLYYQFLAPVLLKEVQRLGKVVMDLSARLAILEGKSK